MPTFNLRDTTCTSQMYLVNCLVTSKIDWSKQYDSDSDHKSKKRRISNWLLCLGYHIHHLGMLMIPTTPTEAIEHDKDSVDKLTLQLQPFTH
ncbi:unnamed protein product [Lupinus luteus]|uniref:Uncharacterized protein n=1 Tax=Lupinus luteus TaxID=3873 RepID=A0AAV1YCV0_LUPLU